MLLSELLPLPPEHDRPITGLTLDSRTVLPGNVFLALAGTKTHGEIFITTALQKGAVAVLKETPVANTEILTGGIPCINVPNLSQQLGELAARFYGHPSRNIQIIGVTGTNGKTSITHFIAQILHAQSTSRPCGLIGTLGYGTYGTLQPGLHTTPDALQLQTLLAQLKTQQAPWTVMEVSSHALTQGRVNGIQFHTAVFTNLSRDHLDYHHTMTAYGEAKRQLFMMPGLKTAVINHDDAFGQDLLRQLPPTVTPLTYSLQHQTADVYAQIHHSDAHGYGLTIHSHWGHEQIQIPLLGKFNVSNLLATLTVLLNLGLPWSSTLTQLSTLRPVPGRMERFGHPAQPTIIVDYAHTPDALQQTLLALREHCQDQLWCIFGCGGNRDRGKRPLMGAVARHHADKIILTNDNPRHEDPQAIINDILPGCPTPTAIITDRTQAIHYALQHAAPEDLILIAGKGHEEYQQIGDQRLPFSDRTLVASLLNG